MKMERILKDLEHISEIKEEMERSRDGHQETVYEAGWGQEFRFFFHSISNICSKDVQLYKRMHKECQHKR